MNFKQIKYLFLLFFITISIRNVKSACDLSKAYLPVDSTCRTFYVCEDDELKIETCPEDLKWDSTYFTCVPPNIVLPGCYSEIVTLPPDTNSGSTLLISFNLISFSVIYLVFFMV
jgi:hypothetical protein